MADIYCEISFSFSSHLQFSFFFAAPPSKRILEFTIIFYIFCLLHSRAPSKKLFKIKVFPHIKFIIFLLATKRMNGTLFSLRHIFHTMLRDKKIFFFLFHVTVNEHWSTALYKLLQCIFSSPLHPPTHSLTHLSSCYHHLVPHTLWARMYVCNP